MLKKAIDTLRDVEVRIGSGLRPSTYTISSPSPISIDSVNLYTTIECTARSSGSTIRWAPIISGRFRCDMAPYPGNE